jgi:hypothetical protein
VFWDYYNASEEFYSVNIDKHYDLFGKDMLFAGGVWLWSGHCPLYSRSLAHTVPALDACRKKGVEEIFATVWLNGSEGNLMLSLAGLAWYADYDYRGGFDLDGVRACFSAACFGVSYDDLMKCELPEHPDGSKLSLSGAFLYNDPLVGLVDKHIEGLETDNYYRAATKTLSEHGDLSVFAPAYDTVEKLSALLENKASFGIRLKAAYDAGNREALKGLIVECDVIRDKIEALRRSHRAAWMTYYKPFGWEVMEIRYGGLLARFDTAKERITAYLSGEIDSIEELQEERLRLDGQLCENAEPRFHSRFLWMGYTTYASAGVF